MVERVLPTSRQLVAGNRQLPDGARQNMVLLRFVEPIPKAFVWEFLRIHLTPAMFDGGESGFYRVDLSQPHHAQLNRVCPHCHRPAPRRAGSIGRTCLTAGCPNRGKTFVAQPKRGVLRVLVPSDALSRREDGTLMTSMAALVLDRRYRENVLAAIYRTAGRVADMNGWRIK